MLLRSSPRAKVGVARMCAMRALHIRVSCTDRPSIMSVLTWAAISVLGTEYGRWPTAIIIILYIYKTHQQIGVVQR